MLEQTQIKQFVGLRRRSSPGIQPSKCRAAQRGSGNGGAVAAAAGAGSGKTTVLIHRIANLIKYGCGSDSNEVPDWVTPEDVRCLEAYLKNPEESRRQRAEMLCKLHPAAPWSILAITFTNKAAGS